jgi:GLPGLI family protein
VAVLAPLTFINLNARCVNFYCLAVILALKKNIMKKVLFSCLALVTIARAEAQQKEGKVIYQRTIQMQFVTISDAPGEENTTPRTRTDKFEVNFANGQMISKQMEDEIEDDNAGGEGGVMIRTMGGGADDAVFCDFEKSRKVEAREFFDKKFIINDSIRRGNWKLSDETKTILNHSCRKATSQRIGKKMMMNMDNGKMERKEMDDTSTVVAWFTTDIPVSAGPEMQGQLPGLILALETNNGKTVYTALEISPKANIASIKEPTKGKKVTPEEFTKERNKMMDEMEKNNQGGNFRIRVN